MKTLVVYYSLSGNTKRAAEYISSILNADMVEIEDLERRMSVFGIIKSIIQALTGKPAKIASIDKDIKDYDLILLCSPVWAGRMGSPARAFIVEYGEDIEKIAYLIMRGSPRNEYRYVWDAMDSLTHAKHIAAVSVHENQELRGVLDDFANAIQNLFPK